MVRYCPTLLMLADFFTKPLQGNLFRKFRDVLLGQAHVDSLVSCLADPPTERVGDSVVEHREKTTTGAIGTGVTGTVNNTVTKNDVGQCDKDNTNSNINDIRNCNVWWRSERVPAPDHAKIS